MSLSSRGDLFARVVGFLVFLIGVAIILGVVWFAFEMFTDPNLGRIAANPKGEISVAEVASGFGRLIFRIALLFLASICGSLVANKGINLYFSALQATPVKQPPETQPEEGVRCGPETSRPL